MPDLSRRELVLGSAALALGGGLARAEDPARRIVTDPGEAALRHGLAGVEVGCAHDPAGPTGVTVLRFPQRALTVADHRGGSPVTSGPDQIREGGVALDALCFAGGSLYGLGAADGVARAIFAQRQQATHWDRIALVCGAVIYDFGLRATSLVPDGALGARAWAAARGGVVPRGPRGAGAGASVGKWFPGTLLAEAAGQGAAYRAVGQTQVLVLSVVNALGAIVDRQGKVVRGHRDPKTGARVAVGGAALTGPPRSAPPGGNTTLTAVVTNRRLGAGDLRLLAKEVHSSMARAIHPFHGRSDGDVLYAISAGTVDADPAVNLYQLSAMASELAWEAVLTSF